MHHGQDFLIALTLVLCIAAAITALFQWLRQPVVLGYILAGLVIGPHVPIPLVADTFIVQTLSELGVILVMFSLGLEFRLGKLGQIASTAGLTALIECSSMLWLGFLCGRMFGWSTRESIFTGAIVAISSTTIIARAFAEQNVRGRVRELVLGILVAEDLIAILLMATLTAMASGSGLSAEALAMTVGRLALFLTVLVGAGLALVPRSVRALTRLGRDETILIASIGLSFAMALLAQRAGYSVALGAFLGGSLVAESGESARIEPLVRPVRDVFAAIFFVSVGMLIDPVLVMQNWKAVLLLTLVVMVGKMAGVSLGAFLTGNGPATSIRAGMSMAQIGEFSFIIAGLGSSLGATRHFLYPVAIAVSALTAMSTPSLVKMSERAAQWVDRQLPQPLQTFATLYGVWIERLRATPSATPAQARLRRLLWSLVMDGGFLAAIIIGTAMGLDGMAARAVTSLRVDAYVAWLGVILLASALASPFVVGIVRVSRRLGVLVAEIALPRRSDDPQQLDLAETPRRALVVSVQMAGVLFVGMPLLAVTQPFVAGWQGGVALLAITLILVVLLWRSALDLQGHVRAAAEVLVEALATQSHQSSATHDHDFQDFVPGLGVGSPVRLRDGCRAIGQTLAQLNLRALTGATVLAIQRVEGGLVVPSPQEALRAGDVLALSGTSESVETARVLLGLTDVADVAGVAGVAKSDAEDS